MTHAELDQLYRKVLGRGMYTPEILLPRIARAIKAAGHVVTLDSSADLARLPVEALQPAADYLNGGHYEATPDVDRASRMTRKAS